MNNAASIIHVPRRFVAHEWGGTETVVAEVARQQQKAGYAPKIVTSMALADCRRETIQNIPVERYPHHYPFLGLSKHDIELLDKKGGNLLSLGLFAGLLREPGVRLYHAHCLKRLGGEVATAARWRKIPFVVTLHGGVFDVPQAEREDLVRPIQGKMEWGRLFGAIFGSRQVLERADMVICVGRSEAEAAAHALPHGRVAHLPNGVDVNKFSQGEGGRFRKRFGIPQDSFLFANISRIDAQKNQAELVAAFSRVADRRPEARLLLMGPETQPEYAEKIRREVAQTGLAGRVILLPGLRNDDSALPDAYAACDAFVLPSRHEPFGIVVLEAWSASRPVIVSRVGGLVGLVKDECNGLCFTPGQQGSVEQLAAQMERLISDQALRQKIAFAGRREAQERYDWSAVHSQLEQIYQQAEQHHQTRFGSRASQVQTIPC
jgi:glycosyltransferase involved in cell wall biosynthesis